MAGRQRLPEELLACGDVWSMSRSERRSLHDALVRLRYVRLVEAVREVQEEYGRVQDELRAEYDQADQAVLCAARVVGMTTSGVAKLQRLVGALQPRVLLVEEAAEVFEAHVAVCLSRSVEHVVLVGDHQQLRPKPNQWELQAASGRGLDLDVSLFERLVRQEGLPVATLEEQRRMRPGISRLIRSTLYPLLRDHPSVCRYPPVRGLALPSGHGVCFLDHDHPEGGGGEDRSKYNTWEAEFVVALARHMLLQGYAPSDLVILVTYAGQLHHVKRCLEAAQLRLLISERDREQMEMARLEAEEDGEEEGDKDKKAGPSGGATTTAVLSSVASRKGPGAPSWGPPPNEDMHVPPGSRVVTMKEGVRVATVDNFQGEEATLVLLSTVRNNKEGRVGFINMTNRVNVMLSRARHGMVVLGNAATLRAAQLRGAGMWGQVLDILDKDGCVDSCLKTQCVNHGTVTEIREVADFQRLAGDGGCQLPCGAALPCGHTCPRRCHADDLQHVSVVCTKPCQRLHPECGHPCDRTCGEPCGRCERTITEPFRLDCGHTAVDVPCWKRYESGAIQCREPVEVDLAGCGHTLTVPCCEAEGVRAGAVPCRAPVTVQLPVCGHSVTVACGARQAALRDPTACTHKCGQLLGCEHTCGAECGKCVRAVLVDNAEELMEGWLQQQPVELRDAWTRHTGGAAAARLDLLLRFLAPGSPADGHRDAYYTWLKSRLTDAGHARRYAGSHRRCTRRCGRVLVCGHECGEACHAGRPCGGCRQPCWIGCAHHRCRRPCGEPCVPCAEPCVWRCEHRGAG